MNMKMKANNKIRTLMGLLVGIFVLSTLAIAKQGSWMGWKIGKQQSRQTATVGNVRTLQDGTLVVNTTHLASDVTGYAGKTPLEISVKDGRIVAVKVLPNEETEEFFGHASTLLRQYEGKSLDEAANMKVDAVSGATFSSRALIANMQRGLAYARKAQPQAPADSFDCSTKNIAGIVVVLMAAILPLFVKNRRYHLLQMVLNVVVLGFWCGTFLSYTSLIGFAAQGVHLTAVAIAAVMLVTAFIYPLLGKKSYYCTHVCPFGALQALTGKACRYKLRFSPKTLRGLNQFRRILWAVLMLLVWTGLWSKWTDYEPFSAFIFQSASWIVLLLAAVILLVSSVITRPYCRFVCPMGTLFRLCQGQK